MLDPFKDCPYVILGVPPFAHRDTIISEWKKHVLNNHPDKNDGSEISNLKTQIINCAKERALSQYDSFERRYASRLVREMNEAQIKVLWNEAEQKGKFYETLWMEQRRAGQQRELNDKAEYERIEKLRAKNNTDEEARMSTLRAANDMAEDQRMQRVREENDRAENVRLEEIKEQRLNVELQSVTVEEKDGTAEMTMDDQKDNVGAGKRRMHRRMCESDKIKGRVEQFVKERIAAKEGVFLSCKEIFTEFNQHSGIDKLYESVFYRQLKSVMAAVFHGATNETVVYRGNRGYRGICFRAV